MFNDAIEIAYDYYMVNTGYGFELPLGHAAVISVDPATGKTKYYEFGRYTDKQCGNVRCMGIPDVKIGQNGLPTPESLTKLYDFISVNYGKSSHVTATYYADSDFQATINYAESFMKEHACYSIFSNNCKTFAHDAATACKEGQTCK